MSISLRGATLAVAMSLALSACAKPPSERDAEKSASGARRAIEFPMPPLPLAMMVRPRAPEVRARAEVPSLPAAALESSVLDSSDDGERRFIRRADATFEVADVHRSAQAIEKLVARHGGFVLDNSIRTRREKAKTRSFGDGQLLELTPYVVHGQLQLRLPSANTQAFLRDLAKQVEFLHERSFTAEEVQFELLRRRLAQARNQQALRAHSDSAEGGGRVSDRTEAIQARTAAQEARDDTRIEQQGYEDRIAFSTIDLSVRQAPQLRRSVQVDVDAALRDAGPGFLSRLRQALVAGWQDLLRVALRFGRLWPLWLLASAALIAARWWWRRRR